MNTTHHDGDSCNFVKILEWGVSGKYNHNNDSSSILLHSASYFSIHSCICIWISRKIIVMVQLLGQYYAVKFRIQTLIPWFSSWFVFSSTIPERRWLTTNIHDSYQPALFHLRENQEDKKTPYYKIESLCPVLLDVYRKERNRTILWGCMCDCLKRIILGWLRLLISIWSSPNHL